MVNKMVKITTIKQKYYIRTDEKNIDAQLKEIVDGIKHEIKHKGYGDMKITVDITFMTGKETEIYIKAEGKNK